MRSSSLLLPALTMALGLALAGCGGGGGSSGGAPGSIVSPNPPQVLMQTLTSQAGLDGYVTDSGSVLTDGRFGNLVGDFDSNGQADGVRAFLSFDLASIPANAIIDRATLRVAQVDVHRDPYPSHGELVVSHTNYGFTLDAVDYSAVLSFNIGTLFTSAVERGYKELDVTRSLRDDFQNTRPRSQYRIEFRTTDTNNDGATNFVALGDTENFGGTNQPPQLVI